MTIMPHSDRVGGGDRWRRWPDELAQGEGAIPTVTVAVTALAAVSITETVLSA
jgi:hypothetical protein